MLCLSKIIKLKMKILFIFENFNRQTACVNRGPVNILYIIFVSTRNSNLTHHKTKLFPCKCDTQINNVFL